MAERLKMLVDEGVFERRLYSERPERYEYRLTEKGIALYPVVISLLDCGEPLTARDIEALDRRPDIAPLAPAASAATSERAAESA